MAAELATGSPVLIRTGVVRRTFRQVTRSRECMLELLSFGLLVTQSLAFSLMTEPESFRGLPFGDVRLLCLPDAAIAVAHPGG